jgi:hypothetical protein
MCRPGPPVSASRTFLARLRSRGKLSGTVCVTAVPGGVLAVDGARGIWLGTAPDEQGAIRELVATIEAALGTAVRMPGEPIDPRHLLRLPEQLRYAEVGAPFALPDGVRGLVTRTGQALVRELAWRLPGFGRSTLPYLWENVLAFDAEVEIEADRFVVQLGNPPLQLVLSLAGMNRREFTLEATEDRTWTLARRP